MADVMVDPVTAFFAGVIGGVLLALAAQALRERGAR